MGSWVRWLLVGRESGQMSGAGGPSINAAVGMCLSMDMT